MIMVQPSSMRRFLPVAILLAGLVLFFTTGLNDLLNFQSLAVHYASLTFLDRRQQAARLGRLFPALSRGRGFLPADCQPVDPRRGGLCWAGWPCRWWWSRRRPGPSSSSLRRRGPCRQHGKTRRAVHGKDQAGVQRLALFLAAGPAACSSLPVLGGQYRPGIARHVITGFPAGNPDRHCPGECCLYLGGGFRCSRSSPPAGCPMPKT